jgi:hypothetical protein
MFSISCKAIIVAIAAIVPAAANEPRLVDWQDLYANPERYRDMPIRTRQAQCFAAGPEDFRCTSPDGSVLISSTIVIGDVERERIERHCDTVRKATSNRACLHTLRFVYLERPLLDTIGPMPKRTIRAVVLDIRR